MCNIINNLKAGTAYIKINTEEDYNRIILLMSALDIFPVYSKIATYSTETEVCKIYIDLYKDNVNFYNFLPIGAVDYDSVELNLEDLYQSYLRSKLNGLTEKLIGLFNAKNILIMCKSQKTKKDLYTILDILKFKPAVGGTWLNLLKNKSISYHKLDHYIRISTGRTNVVTDKLSSDSVIFFEDILKILDLEYLKNIKYE